MVIFSFDFVFHLHLILYQVSDWWEDYVYLAGRSPIMVNSNFYGLETIMVKPLSPIQSARAANITFLLLKFMRLIDREEVSNVLLLENKTFSRVFLFNFFQDGIIDSSD